LLSKASAIRRGSRFLRDAVCASGVRVNDSEFARNGNLDGQDKSAAGGARKQLDHDLRSS